MNKKANTILFIIGGTAFNVLLMIVFLFILVGLSVKFIWPLLPGYPEFEETHAPLFVILFCFVASIALSFVVYRAVIKLILTKIDAEKYFDPLFVRSKLKKNQ